MPRNSPHFMITLITIACILTLLYILLLLMYRAAWKRAPTFTGSGFDTAETFITVLIPARNEAENLPMLLHTLRQQTYPSHLFEVIVIDDFSTDDTTGVCKKYPFVQVISLADYVDSPINSYKKKAIEIAIGKSKGELIVTTDADCEVQPRWLETIADFYADDYPQFIVMPVLMTHNRHWLEAFQALDFMTLQGITGAAVQEGMHSMCNGANLAYTRSAYDTVNGFEGIDQIASGDDMLLMHKIAARFPSKIKFLKSEDVIVSTQPMRTVRSFFNQRIRWASKADKYDDTGIFWVLLGVYILNAFMFLLPLLSIFYFLFAATTKGVTILVSWAFLLILKTSFEVYFLHPVANFFNRVSLLKYFPLAEPFHIVYTLIAGWLGKFGKYQWKGRKVK